MFESSLDEIKSKEVEAKDIEKGVGWSWNVIQKNNGQVVGCKINQIIKIILFIYL